MQELASHRITRVYRKMVKMGRAIDDDSPAEDLHELRKVGKELRYLLEFFASLYPADVVKPFIKTLKGLQDQLGRFQDREVQANALRELAPEVAEPATVMAMGVLVERFMQGGGRRRAPSSPTASPPSPSKEQRAHGQGAPSGEPVLATYNIKGGVGKTSAAVNLATLAAHDGARTLLWDLDPQGASTYLFRVKPEDQGRRREARARQDRRRRARSRAPTPRASTCCRRTSPTATWTSRSDDAKKPDRRLGARARAARRRVRVHVPRLPAEHLARLRERLRGRRRAARPDHPGDAVARARSSSCTRCSSQRPAGARLLLDGRPPQAAAPRADGRARARARRARDRDPERRPTSSGWAPSAPRSWTSRRAAPRRARVRGPLGRGPRASDVTRSRRGAAAPRAATRAS